MASTTHSCTPQAAFAANAERPTDFATKAKSRTMLIVLERIKK